MIGIAVKAGPGLALRVEDYANTSLKKEMERLKKESVELKKRVNKFQEENNRLSRLGQSRKEETDKLGKALGLIQDKMRILIKMIERDIKMLRLEIKIIGILQKITPDGTLNYSFELRRDMNNVEDDLEFVVDSSENIVGELEETARDLDFVRELNERQQLKD
ncbi:unnamed protein product [marine sediment metagenome]|uniref:Uncharacterized protein n=1 Tax=marine sediment metagenome TaxID=412755 RepID=X1MQN4_9ZZZZ